MKRIFSLISLLSFSFLVAACSREASKPDVSGGDNNNAASKVFAGDIQPRSLGSVWNYVSFYFEDGKKHASGNTTEEVIEVITLEDTPCYLIRLTMDYRGFIDRLLGVKLTEDDNSYYWEYYNEHGSYNYSVDTRTEKPTALKDFELTLPYPTTKGHSYAISGGQTWTVIAVDEIVKTSLGEFKCVVYQITTDAEEQEDYATRDRYYMTSGVGLVRWESDVKEEGNWTLDSMDELQSYDLKLP